MEDCIFCKIAAGTIPCRKVLEDDDILAFHDINPTAPVHVLIIPKRHIPTTLDFEAGADDALAGKLITAAARIARELGIDQSGYRLVFNTNGDGGQEVYHVHLHLLGGRKFSWPAG
ncbi:histidine triad nucleotide-binding protein [Desulfurispirillum indicum]|uniref:Histidine triad (HIT) protein n=1 Tax=Desulfurispirillum indicum (strain ATCC BAA-1389 / DSM 22839 / S5) TaxID=653733 RepID=E6W038_DESIS|nr:histidine triad nucleotide-binding protein [Desulfurispirillum indicum]ADU65164.1 histidine triad (HIT) protein [Desulfurispirillum indicum S5]UCZ57056.1 histidine triad nucleotide-binding protein [Desulfurispirillum indicum]